MVITRVFRRHPKAAETKVLFLVTAVEVKTQAGGGVAPTLLGSEQLRALTADLAKRASPHPDAAYSLWYDASGWKHECTALALARSLGCRPQLLNDKTSREFAAHLFATPPTVYIVVVAPGSHPLGFWKKAGLRDNELPDPSRVYPVNLDAEGHFSAVP